jgi:hypothetical protein
MFFYQSEEAIKCFEHSTTENYFADVWYFPGKNDENSDVFGHTVVI